MTRLPPLNEKLVTDAVAAYRDAVEYVLIVDEKWAAREDELRRLDEFHRTRVAWENDRYRADKLYERAVEFMKVAARGGDHVYVDPFSEKFFPKCRDRHLLKAVKALDAVRTQIERER